MSRSFLSVVLGLVLCGTAVGILLALGFSQLILDACGGDASCQKPLLALIGALGFTQALTVIAIGVLVAQLNRLNAERLREAFRDKAPPF
ncbi:MAG: hypothetical protein OXI77_05250 [Chloroflexota bacterium]|nr:hypothetical protein [Chloroflexota bacterium]MDE2910075.1 hypothetical protein [Chloroflexota bacterium]